MPPPPTGSDGWVADRSAELTPLASALTDTSAEAAALIGAALIGAVLTRRPARGGGSDSAATDPARAAMMAVYLGRPTAWAPPQAVPRPDPSAVTASATLTRLQRAVWVLREVEQLTQAEIASILDRPLAAVGRALAEASVVLGPDAGVTVLRRPTAPSPDLHDVRSAYRRAQRRRARRRSRLRWLVVLGIGALAAVVAVPTVVIPRLPVYVRDPGERVFMHTVTPPTGWQIDSRMLFDSGEATFLSRTYGGAVPCSVFVELETGPSKDAGPTTPVRVNGRAGTYEPDRTSGATVSWRVDDRAHVRVSCQPQTAQDLGDAGRANLLLLAESVRLKRTPVTVPYALTRLPERYAVSALTEGSDGSTALGLEAIDPDPSDVSLVVRYRDSDGAGAVVSPQTVQVNGRDAVLSGDPNQPTLCFTPPTAARPATVCVDAYWPSSTGDRLSAVPAAVLALMTKTAESLTFAGDPADRRTWVDARSAFPR